MLKQFLNSPIRHKIMVLVMCITLSVLLTSYLLFAAYDFHSARKSTIKQIELLASVIGKRIAPLMLMEDSNKANKIISDVTSKESVILACIYTSDGRVLAQFQGQGISKTCPSSNAPIGHVIGWKLLSVNQQITSPNGNVVATFYIESDMREINVHLLNVAGGLIAMLCLAMLMVYLIAHKAQDIIANPILKLADTAKHVTENGEYEARANKCYDDEVGYLTTSFNTMMEQIEESDRQLKKVNDNLEKKVAERTKDLEFTVQRLRKANEDKKIWIQSIGHEIRTPIHGVASFADYGVKEAEDENVGRDKLRNYFDKIQISSARLRKLIDELLEFGKMDAGKAHFHMEPSDMLETVHCVVNELEGVFIEKDIKLDIRQPDFDTKAEFDKDKIVQVLTNLLSNATKFSPQGGIISIEMAPTSISHNGQDVDGIAVSVIDSGIGIPKGEEEDIFNTFTQSSATYDGSGGTGLGLAITKEIVTAHRGDISAKNNNTHSGATFTFSIPLVDTTTTQQQDEA